MLTENVIYEDNKDLNENVKLVDACVDNGIQRFTFEKQVHIKNKVNNWFNEELRTMKREKIIQYLQAKFETTNQAWEEYKLMRNQYKVQIENNKNNYIKSKIKTATNQKQM